MAGWIANRGDGIAGPRRRRVKAGQARVVTAGCGWANSRGRPNDPRLDGIGAGAWEAFLDDSGILDAPTEPTVHRVPRQHESGAR